MFDVQDTSIYWNAICILSRVYFFPLIVLKSKGADCKDADSSEVNQSQF
jgi:hypothetical protein